ncbi:PIN domain-containing protein [bacterium]|nr:PIN domain-containing protein [bacterium]
MLVSALWTPNGKASYIVSQVIAGRIKLCYDYRILAEYRDVLSRPKFKFSDWQINFLLDAFEKDGVSVIADPLNHVPFSDESDRAFYEVAKFCHAKLITGNTKHYPLDDCVVTVSEYYLCVSDNE